MSKKTAFAQDGLLFTFFGRSGSLFKNSVDQAVFKRLLSREEIVTVGVLLDNGKGLAGICRKNMIELILGSEDMLGVDLYIRSLTLEASERLMDHYLAVRKRKTLALRSRGEKECTHACRHSDADRGYVTLDEIHRVIDRKSGRNGSARAVDVEGDVLIRILRLKEKKLGDHK